ncbi:helix-turn-helix domain-containing protein [Streptantibioticus ferralitis]|uniref:Helix-turn-helix domain-containing protein n=1 Tax=Streptantibioticus ferralitis TaxID=236510 RepID=A0ABT5YYS4_9ACTN|nr:XRE family transcriptional regulator [Streptantibioticus ferralitis]MDF2256747.1 helix-turn-helix domain-containing protein [Streptantibioticus ferralitis]
MSDERPLPVECARLAEELRELRRRTGLSLAALAEHTPYSKSSWERYLNGKKLPPRQAVDDLCRLADEPVGRLLALWELAEQAWSGRAGTAVAGKEVGTAAPDGERKATGRARRAFVVSGAAAVAAAVIAALLLLTAGGRGSDRGASGGASATPAYSQSFAPGCREKECEGADPAQMGCGVQGMAATLVTHRAVGGERLDIRYSEQCGAVWVRAMRLRLGDRVRLSLPGAVTKEIRATNQRDTEVYLSTVMTATKVPRKARVCLWPGAGGAPDCFTPPPAPSV